jgi:plastocyanin domain-containing protein
VTDVLRGIDGVSDPGVAVGSADVPYDPAKTDPRAIAAAITAAGYAPDVIVVRQDRPVRLDFYRDETASCSEQLRIPDFGIARDLPAFKTTIVEFTPDKSGEFTFTCGMNMMRGKLVVEAA